MELFPRSSATKMTDTTVEVLSGLTSMMHGCFQLTGPLPTLVVTGIRVLSAKTMPVCSALMPLLRPTKTGQGHTSEIRASLSRCCATKGSRSASQSDMDKICSKVQAARESILELHTPVEGPTLQRCCLNVSRATYLLRCNGDRALAAGLESALWQPLSGDGWVQASLAIHAGGLGMRESPGLAALQAFITSRTTARPMAEKMAEDTKEAGLCQAAMCTNSYDMRTNTAVGRWLGELHLDEGAEAVAKRWHT